MKLAEKVFRTGVQSLHFDEGTGKFYVHLLNTTNDTWVEISLPKAGVWRAILA